MKVRCINNLNGDLSLTIGKEYAATATVDSRHFYLINDNNQFGEYLKCRFEIVEENKMKVRCINNLDNTLSITVGKVYDVLSEQEYAYQVQCDYGGLYCYPKKYFEIVEENMLKCISNNVIDDFGSTKIVKRNPLNVNLRTSEIQSLISELNTLHKELEVCVIIHDWGYFIHSWFGEFKVNTEQDVLEALNEMLKLVKRYKGENDDNG